MIPTAVQLKAARQLLEWSRDDVAGACGLDVAEIVSFEAGLRALHRDTLGEIRKTLEAAGVEFDRNGSGVKLKVGE
jgi:transcriptional regulator with XRE-family HTH domain